MILDQRTFCLIKEYPLVDIFLPLFTYLLKKCTNIVRRSSVLVTAESEKIREHEPSRDSPYL